MLKHLKHQIKERLSRVIRKTWRRYSKRFNREGLKPYLLYERSGYPLDIPVNLDDDLLIQEMRQFATHCHQEYVYDYLEPCYIEPSHGYILTDQLFLVDKSFSYYHMFDYTSTRMLWNVGISKIRKNAAIKRIETAVSLRDPNEGNYWHFYDDILSKLLIIDRLNLNKDIPLLVGERLWKTRFFQSAIQRGTLKNRNWMLHTEIVRANRLIFCIKMSLQRENLDFALEALDFQPRQAMAPAKRVFLNRSKSRGRYLANLEEVIAVLQDFDFQVIDGDRLELQEQMELFAQARYVVGIHGAGLVNLIYRRNQELNLLELFPPNCLHPHYIWLCHTFGYGYDALVGNGVEASESFVVDLNKLRTKVANMLHPNRFVTS